MEYKFKVGDKVRHTSGVEVEAYKINIQGEGNRTELLVKDGIHILPMWLDEFVKIIGEISPYATWVKDGDEYLFGKIDKNGYIYPYNQEDEKYIKFWTERGFRDLPNI